jgi:hypothetical protein
MGNQSKLLPQSIQDLLKKAGTGTSLRSDVGRLSAHLIETCVGSNQNVVNAVFLLLIAGGSFGAFINYR